MFGKFVILEALLAIASAHGVLKTPLPRTVCLTSDISNFYDLLVLSPVQPRSPSAVQLSPINSTVILTVLSKVPWQKQMQATNAMLTSAVDISTRIT